MEELGMNKDVIYYPKENGIWYTKRGGVGVFFVEMPLEEFLKLDDVEELEDDDMFTWSGPINSLEELIEAVEC